MKIQLRQLAINELTTDGGVPLKDATKIADKVIGFFFPFVTPDEVVIDASKTDVHKETTESESMVVIHRVCWDLYGELGLDGTIKDLQRIFAEYLTFN